MMSDDKFRSFETGFTVEEHSAARFETGFTAEERLAALGWCAPSPGQYDVLPPEGDHGTPITIPTDLTGALGIEPIIADIGTDQGYNHWADAMRGGNR